MKITHLRHIALKAPDAPKLATFYQDIWGLKIVAEQAGVYYLRGVLPEQFILAIVPAERKGIDHIAFGLADKAAVDAAANELAAKGVPIHRSPAPLATPGGGYGFQAVDPEGRCLEFSSDVAPAGDQVWPAPVRPNKISHTVLNTADFEGITAFYTDILGLRISDWSERQMVFLRCNTDHHSIAFNRAPHASLNHVAYELPDTDAVMRGIGTLKRAGVPAMWGPGRHGPGNNVFCYFQDAAGYVCEYTAEVQKIDEASHEPQVWERVPEKMDRWGISGPPSPEARAAMAGEPDPGLLVKG
ncbi:MAG TPA: VOC family protein [Chloroflexia bacterium]|nr:VOC family protein [Chloroflexia bacterium]